MNSNPPKHIEPTSSNHQGVEDQNGPCAQSGLSNSESFTGSTDAASMDKSALNPVPDLTLMEQIVDNDNMECAWARVKANRGAPGPDGITIDDFPEHFQGIWPVVRQQLLDGTYQPGAARRKSIPKPDGSQRHLGIPTQPAKSTFVQSAFG